MCSPVLPHLCYEGKYPFATRDTMRAVHLECKTSRSPLVFTCACCWDANPVSPSVGAIIPTERVPFDVCVYVSKWFFVFFVRQFNRNIIWARQKTLLVDGTSYLRSIWSVQKGVLFVTILCVQLCVGCFFFPASSRCYSRISLPSFNYNPFERQTVRSDRIYILIKSRGCMRETC